MILLVADLHALISKKQDATNYSVTVAALQPVHPIFLVGLAKRPLCKFAFVKSQQRIDGQSITVSLSGATSRNKHNAKSQSHYAGQK